MGEDSSRQAGRCSAAILTDGCGKRRGMAGKRPLTRRSTVVNTGSKYTKGGGGGCRHRAASPPNDSMNEILNSLHSRKSVRAYTEEPVSPEERQAILEAACAAPTAGNQQLYTILEITDQGLKDRLAVTCDNQPFIAKAPLVLIFCADCQKWYDAFSAGGCGPRRPGAGDLLLAFCDAAIAAQNAVTAAESLGLGSCYIGDILEQCETHRALLGLPEYVVPAAMLVIGRPTEQQKARPKPERCALSHIVHRNGYRRMDGPELREMLAKNAGPQGYEAWLSAFCARKYNSDFSREMTRSAQVYLSAFAPGTEQEELL